MILKRKKKKVNSVLSTHHKLCSARFPTSCCFFTSSLFSFEAYVPALVSLQGFSGRPWGDQDEDYTVLRHEITTA